MARDSGTQTGPTVQVRPATVGDMPGVRRLFDEVDAFHAALDPTAFQLVEGGRPEAFLTDVMSDPHSDVLVAVLDAEIVGLLSVQESARPDIPTLVPKRFAALDNMVVTRLHRREGIGRALLQAAHEWATERGLESVQLSLWSTNTGAIELYQSMGYRRFLDRMELDL